MGCLVFIKLRKTFQMTPQYEIIVAVFPNLVKILVLIPSNGQLTCRTNLTRQ